MDNEAPNYKFIMTMVECDGCGLWFDITKTLICPRCGEDMSYLASCEEDCVIK